MIPTDLFLILGFFLLFLAGGALVFLFGSSYYNLFPTNRSLAFKAGLPVVFLLLTLCFARVEPLVRYSPVAYAFFMASAANLTATLSGPWLLRLLKVPDQSIKGIGLAKLSEGLVVVSTIVLLAALGGIDLGSIYLRAGNLPLGLSIGLVGFGAFAVIAYNQVRAFQLGARTLLALLPWVLTFVLSNALMEELWFRGIFLGAFEPFIGALAALLLTSIVFTGAHVGATYLSWPERVRFLIILFPLALAWGFAMQWTGSLIGSTLFHAGGDLLIINGFIKAFHGYKYKE